MAVNYSAKEEADGHPSGGVGVPGGGAVGGGGGGAVKTRKPDNTAFKQQRLPAWQPILTAGTVLPAFFIIGLIFIPIGIGIFVTSNNIREYEVRGAGVPGPGLWEPPGPAGEAGPGWAGGDRPCPGESRSRPSGRGSDPAWRLCSSAKRPEITLGTHRADSHLRMGCSLSVSAPEGACREVTARV